MQNQITGCFKTAFFIALILFGSQYSLLADDFKAQKDDSIEIVTVIGSKSKAQELAGSGDFISSEDLEAMVYTDVLRVLRQAPGVYLQEEEGFGLRPNIGIRGSGSERSSRISLLEDGVLIAPAPYASPSAYYFPTQMRMSAVEVLKGPSAIRVGARTVGGAINFVSTPIPNASDEFKSEITAFYGTDNTHQLLARTGNKLDNFGYLFEVTSLGSDGFKSIPGVTSTTPIRSNADGFSVQDYLAKLSYDLETANGATNHFELKLSKTDQDADSSYLGLTGEDFAEDPFQRYAASQLDNIVTDHEQIQLNYLYTPTSAEWQLGITAYNNNFFRNWYKLHETASASLGAILADPITYATEFGWLNGSIDSPDDALEIRANKRNYYARGLQAEFNGESYLGDTSLLWTAGLRLHHDQEDRFQDQDGYRIENGQLILTTDAAPGSKTNRVSDAETLAFYLETDIKSGNWTWVPGLRYEKIDLTRNDFSTTDPTRSEGPTRVRENTLDVFIPGLGVTYALNDNWLLLGGIHKGFNPPAPGSSSQEEESTNFEVGFRYNSPKWQAEVISFHNDYDNIVGTVTAATGGVSDGTVSIGDQFDGGQATVSGFEVDFSREFVLANGWELPLRLTHTWTHTYEFDNAFESGFDPWGDVQIGDQLPYIPEHQYQISFGLNGSTRSNRDWSSKLLANYTGTRRAVAGQDSNDLLESHFLLDWVSDYQWSENTRLILRAENLLDETYITAARPFGFRPGKNRSFMLGVNVQF